MTSKTAVVGFALILGLWVTMFIAPAAVYAVTAPTTGSFAYDVYDIAVEKLLKGPVGFVSGVAAMIFGAVTAISGRVLPSVLPILGGAMLLKADAIVNSMGLIF